MGLHKLYGQVPQADIVDLVSDLAGKSATGHTHGASAPASHAASHASGGSDPVSPAAIGAATSGHSHAEPLVRFAPQTFTDAATITLDASLGDFFRGSMATANRTLGNPSNGTDGQRVLVEVLASGATRTLTITPTIGVTGVTSPISIPSGKRWFGGLLLSSGVWYLIGSAVQP